MVVLQPSKLAKVGSIPPSRSIKPGSVAELAYATDLKSVDHNDRVGSSPIRTTILIFNTLG